MVGVTGGSATEAMNITYGVTGKCLTCSTCSRTPVTNRTGVKGLVQQPFIVFLAVFASLGGMLFG